MDRKLNGLGYSMAVVGNHEGDLAVLRERLAEAQRSQIFHNRRAIILLEGLNGSGKKAALKQIVAAFDPCHVTVHATRFDRRESADGHWLARYWRQLPGAGDTTIFFRGWYRRVLDDRLAGRVDDRSVQRAFDEINEFEAQQRDAGTLIVKLFFSVDASIQHERLRLKAQSRWYRESRAGPVTRADDPDFLAAFHDMKRLTDTRWSPWAMIDGTDEEAAARAALTVLADAWEAALPAEPARLIGGNGRAA